MHLLGILFEIYLATFAQISAYTPSEFLRENHALKNYHSPLNGELDLIGNCGELRANHFHTGWDLSTQGHEGMAVFAIEDGYISRIRISSSGYGKAIYITHPNGLTSVYAHLSRFDKSLDSLVLSEMHRLKQNEFDWYWPAESFRVHKGDCIAYSGNTGSSTGPHLHFELRDAFTEIVYNPARLFEKNITDEIAPSLTQIMLSVKDKNGVRQIVQKQKVKDGTVALQSPSKHFYLSICALDKAGKGKHTLGVYQAVLKNKNGEVLYAFSQDELNFANGRYANAVNDYLCQGQKGSAAWYTLFQTSNNHWPAIKHYNDGIELDGTGQSYYLSLKDEKGLGSTYKIEVKLDATKIAEDKKARNLICLEAGKALTFSPDEHCSIQLSAEALYESIYWWMPHAKMPFPSAFHKPALVKMVLPGVAISKKQGSYIVVKREGKQLEQVKVLWKGDTAVFQVKECGTFEYNYDAEPISASVHKGSIQLKHTQFLSSYTVEAMPHGDWMAVEYQTKTSTLRFLDKKTLPKQVKLSCKDIFGREYVQLLVINR